VIVGEKESAERNRDEQEVPTDDVRTAPFGETEAAALENLPARSAVEGLEETPVFEPGSALLVRRQHQMQVVVRVHAGSV
jgi:hypothetical protein